jgi:hypothetical protein
MPVSFCHRVVATVCAPLVCSSLSVLFRHSLSALSLSVALCSTLSRVCMSVQTQVERETVSRFGGEDLADARNAEGIIASSIGKPTQVRQTVASRLCIVIIVVLSVTICGSYGCSQP